MDPDPSTSTFFLIPALLAANAFFVAAEFALIAVRRGRIEQNAREGDRRAARSLVALDRAEELALAAQVGSSAATVTLGYIVARFAYRLSEQTFGGGSILLRGGVELNATPVFAVIAALALATFFQVLLSEQIPKIVGSQHAETLLVRVALRPLQLLALLLRPFLWVLGYLVGGLARVVRLSPTGLHPLVHTPEEIRLLVAQGHEHGVVEEDERQMIHGVFEFSDTVAREVMTPRTDMIALPVESSLEETIAVVIQEGHSRIPVYEGTLDNIVGVLLAKDLLPILHDGTAARQGGFDLRSLMREPYFVPDTKPIDDILAEFRQQSTHLAMVLDEFGGTYGLLTMEDLLEEIVGDINDEYDVVQPEFSSTPEGDVLIDGGASISEVNERFELGLPETDFDTIGGYIFGALGRVPLVGDVVEVAAAGADVRLEVDEVEERRVTRVRMTRLPVGVIEEQEVEVRG